MEQEKRNLQSRASEEEINIALKETETFIFKSEGKIDRIRMELPGKCMLGWS